MKAYNPSSLLQYYATVFYLSYLSLVIFAFIKWLKNLQHKMIMGVNKKLAI